MNKLTRTMTLRRAAHLLLDIADRLDGTTAYAVLHSHKFGNTCTTGRFSDDPHETIVKESLNIDFEPDRGENLEWWVLSTSELCGIKGLVHVPHYPTIPAQPKDTLFDAVRLMGKQQGHPNLLATLYKGDLSSDAFLVLTKVVGLLHQQASSEHDNGEVAFERITLEDAAQ